MSHVILFHVLYLAVAALLFHLGLSQTQFVDCPPGCSTSRCPLYVGCSVCKNGFCLHVNETTSEGECLTSCPEKFFCERIFLSVCKACKDSDCEVCDSSGLCKTCLPGFTLSSATQTCSKANTSTASSVDLSQAVG